MYHLAKSAFVIVFLIFALPVDLQFGGGDVQAQSNPALIIQLVASGLTSPVGLVSARDGSNRLFIVEQAGIVKIHNGAQVLPAPFLDITSKVLSGGERGLLGLAFDSNYASNSFFYLFYTSKPTGAIAIARYSVSADTNLGNPNSELILKTQPHSDFANHNGGSLAFGPDGCLYAGIGDGGSGGDPQNNGQNLGTLLGKIIRINPADGNACSAAPGNPFVGTAGARAEIWALGLRNPWRITFDRVTGDLFIADVGQGIREEVNFQPPGSSGKNYCWRRKEGTLTFDATVPCTIGTPTDPILEYDHQAGDCSVTGGYRYRGSQIAGLAGTYFYGDYCTGKIWGATEQNGVWTATLLFDTDLLISSFGEDDAGEIYVVGHGGTVSRIASGATSIVAAVAPNARTTTVGNIVTGFATILNSGTVAARSCSITLPSGTPATFTYQTTNAQNVPVGTQNTSVDISAGGGQSFVFAVTPTAAFEQDIPLVFDCLNSSAAPVISGVNTFLVTASTTPLPDVLSIADTQTHEGITHIPTSTGTGLMVAAAVNIGADGTVTCAPTPTPPGQPARTIDADLSICQTSGQGNCTNPTTPGPSSTLTINKDETAFFSIFVRGQGRSIPFDPANRRLFFLCTAGTTAFVGAPVGAASVAVCTGTLNAGPQNCAPPP